MSFFGFDTKLPRDRSHPSGAPGFGETQDPFAALARGREQQTEDDDAGIDFEDTYDGLGDALDETDDAFNDDTFGGGDGGAEIKTVGKDFDFYGSTAQVAGAINEEQMRYSRQQAPSRTVTGLEFSQVGPPLGTTASKPARSGYEKYRDLEHVSDLQVDAALWGAAVQPQAHSAAAWPVASPAATAPQRKMLSLEEVEEQMAAQNRRGPASQLEPNFAAAPFSQHEPIRPDVYPPTRPQEMEHPGARLGPGDRGHDLRMQPLNMQDYPPPGTLPQAELPAPSAPLQPRFQHDRPPGGSVPPPMEFDRGQAAAQHVVNESLQAEARHALPRPNAPRGPAQPLVTHPQQIANLSEEERALFLEQEAKRAKRNHKIFLLSKDNGIMSPQDKNFITRIQLQQLMAASGNTAEQNADGVLAEDFYYQVYSQIRSGSRPNPHQPLNHFAQTYLLQTGSRHGGGGRRNNRGGDTHMQRMEQQVQRAVEAAKRKPKGQQLVIEGSLGKIAFSNVKAPRTTLSVKRPEAPEPSAPHSSASKNVATKSTPGRTSKTSNPKTVLKDLENLYTALMKMEEESRKEPPPAPPPSHELNATIVQQHREWSEAMQTLNDQLWEALHVTDTTDSPSSTHPFIAMLGHAKGKKILPRTFRHLSPTQRLNLLTVLLLHLDQLDVIQHGQLTPVEPSLPPSAREAVELFFSVDIPPLFSFISDGPLFHIIGFLGLVLDRGAPLSTLARTKTGLAILTMLTSRATLIKELSAGGSGADTAGQLAGEAPRPEEWAQWTHAYDRLFDTLEPLLPTIFPMPINTGEDMYIWQFLAAVGSAAGPEQQQRLVIAVKDRVMDTVTQARTLPPEMASQRLGNVNLFMRAIGLDVELLG